MTSVAVETPEELAERVQNGDAGAESEFVNCFYETVSHLVRSRIHDREAALDVIQDVMLAVLRAVRERRVHRLERLPQYVYGTALHRVCDYFRHREEVQPSEADPPASDDATPEQIAARHEQLEHVRDAYRELRLVDRAILGMVIADSLSAGEIAERTGMNPDQVRQRKSRAIRKIRRNLRR